MQTIKIDNFFEDLKTGYTVLFCKNNSGEECLISLPNNWLFREESFEDLKIEYAPHDGFVLNYETDKMITKNFEIKPKSLWEFKYNDEILYCEKVIQCNDIWSLIKQLYKEKYDKEMPDEVKYTNLNGATIHMRYNKINI